MRLQGKTAIVTGAGQGIGAAIARCFSEEGAKVAIFEKNARSGREQAKEITKANGTARFYHCDVTNPDSVSNCVNRSLNDLGVATVLVNNAGANVFFEPLKMPPDEWDQCLRLDLEAAWLCAREVLPGMCAAGTGSIVNIASTHSFKIIPGTFPYPVAKHGLIGLTRSLGIEYARKGVRANAIAPGYIETQLVSDYWAEFPDPAAEKQRVCDLHPPGRIGTPKEVAATALFLASDEAPFINAETITIDGGRTKLYHE